jgi:hypothetical protein
MFCHNCGKELFAGCKFCPNCGTKIDVDEITEVIKSNNSHENKPAVVLDNDFYIEVYNLFHENIFERIEQVHETVDIHSRVRLLDSSIIKKNYVHSIKKIIKCLINSARESLSQEDIDYIKEKEEEFLSGESEEFYELLEELNEKSILVLNDVSNSNLELFAKSVKIGLNGLGALESFFGGYKAANAEQKILDDYNHTVGKIFDHYDVMWDKFGDLINEISENTPIIFKLDEEALKEHFNKKDPIEEILEKYLLHDDSPFYFYSEIPAKKRAGAKDSYVNLDDDEKIICLNDTTVFGGAREGICFSSKGVYSKELGEEGVFINYSDIKKVTVREGLFINGDKIECDEESRKLVKKALEEIKSLFDDDDEDEDDDDEEDDDYEDEEDDDEDFDDDDDEDDDEDDDDEDDDEDEDDDDF